jgi:hypothetical protein
MLLSFMIKTTLTLEGRVIRLEKIIEAMIPKAEQWVGPTIITKMTGWDCEGMRRARRNGSVKYKRSPTGGYRYLLSSVIF